MRILSTLSLLLCTSVIYSNPAIAQEKAAAPKAADYQQWRLPATAPAPANNKPTEARVALGKMLFFDPRLSRDGNMSCASCHNPSLGWADGLAKGRGFAGKELGRATPSITNSAFNTIHMWDGRKKTLEDQATGPMESAPEMNSDMPRVFAWLNKSPGYKTAFTKAYPGEAINADTLQRAIASFERTIVTTNTPFDRWLAGDKKAMTNVQLQGLVLFNDKEKTNCAACHAAPSFTDNGFHNIGLASFGDANPDLGRYAQKPVAAMKGAFKTPSLRDVEMTAPYFHDGSAETLLDVINHYAAGGAAKSNLSPNIKPLALSDGEKNALVEYMRALTGPAKPLTYPTLPAN